MITHFSVVRCTSACPPCQCTSSLTTSTTSARCAGRLSVVPGCCKDIWDLTLEINPMDVLTVGNPLLTGPIFVLTCRPIRLSKTSIANAVTNPSPWSPISTNTTSRPVLKTSPFHPLRLHRTLPHPLIFPSPAVVIVSPRSLQVLLYHPALALRSSNNRKPVQQTANTSSIFRPRYSPTPHTLSKFETSVLEKFLMKRKSFENNEFQVYSQAKLYH